ncbi:MAG: ribonuclease HII [Acidobacteriota bacterium]|jgi:ribonuclease HII|nr:ribonuclease HII [Acidobacteriota bacterium]
MKKAEREEYLKYRLEEMLSYERSLWESGVGYVAGVDEVGRGPIAGPVCAACVVLPQDFDAVGVNDSKKLSEKKRSELYGVIIDKALAYGIGLVDNRRIDEVNILNATKEAMLVAISDAAAMLAARVDNLAGEARSAVSVTGTSESVVGETVSAAGASESAADASVSAADISESAAGEAAIGHLLVDAVRLPEAGIPGTAIIKGDEKSVSIAAASIIAKVTRDRIMTEFDNIFPGYGFSSNKGYGTEAHYAGLRAHGRTPIHRASFLKNLTETV